MGRTGEGGEHRREDTDTVGEKQRRELTGAFGEGVEQRVAG